MASTVFTVTPSSSVDHLPDSGQPRPLTHGQRIPPDRGNDPLSTAARVNLAIINATDAFLRSSNFGSNCRSQLSDVLSLATMQTLGDSPQTTPQFGNGILETSPVSNKLTLPDPGSALQRRATWCGFFSNGCLSYKRSDQCAELLVSCAPWTDKSTAGLLAEMFREKYFQVFTKPWDINTAASKVITFLGAVQEWLNKKHGRSMLLGFRESVRKAALHNFHLSITLDNAPSILEDSCYLGALFRHGLVREEDIMCALARVARLANRVKYIQVFYFLAEAIVELYPNACAIQEIEQHVVVLRDTLDESDELVSNLPWYQLIVTLIEPYLNHVPTCVSPWT